MGRRYATILEYLGVKVFGHDIVSDATISKALMKKADGFIIATPTQNHLSDIKQLFDYGKPILCEKPFTTDFSKLTEFEDNNREDLALLRMVNQYEYMQRRHCRGETSYDYFKTGSDGLHFDCINLLGLANGKVNLNNKSPYWNVKLNGCILNLGLVDHSYIDMIKDWLKNPCSNWAYTRMAHEKAVKHFEFEVTKFD